MLLVALELFGRGRGGHIIVPAWDKLRMDCLTEKNITICALYTHFLTIFISSQ
jgi:hypothetical protein